MNRSLTALVLAALCAPSTAAADHLVVTTPSYTGPGVASRFVWVQRVSDAGTPLTAGAQGVFVTTDSPTGEFTLTPWNLVGFSDGGLQLGIPAGSSTCAFSYRDKAIKTHNLTVDAPGLATVTAPFTVGPLILDEDFEGNMSMTDTPAGVWPWRALSPGNTLDFGSTAHRGDGGLAARDLDDGSIDGGGSGFLGFFARDLQSSIYFRAWVQRRTLNPGPIGFIAFLSNAGVVSMVELDAAGGVGFGGATNDAGFSWTPNVASIPDNRWTLVSGKLSGLGTDAGRRDLYVGGASPVSQKDQGLLGQGLHTVFLGNATGTPRSFTGDLFVDDVRISVEPTADTVEIIAPSEVPTQGCTLIFVRLFNTIDQVLAPAPYDLDVEVELKGPGQLHLTSDCSDAPTRTVRIAKGTAKGLALLSGGGAIGATSLKPSHIDFLSRSADLTLVAGDSLDGGRLPDGGWDPRAHRDLKVGCGCSASAPLFSSALLLLAFALRRRPRLARAENCPLMDLPKKDPP